ncbi:MAG TPA: methyltransferase domain-containing protein [Acidobacteriota bacterium]
MNREEHEEAIAMDRSIEFFDNQFQRQVREGDFSLNPFEKLALPFLRGRVLDLGCGLGNLTIEAARRGCPVLAFDASVNAIERIRNVVAAEGLPVQAELVDLTAYRISADFDVIVSIGLLMFMKRLQAHEILKDIHSHVRPGGCAIINVLIEGTTYLDMFEPGHYYLFGHSELQDQFAGWDLLESRWDSFEAPGPSIKMFASVAARKPG